MNTHSEDLKIVCPKDCGNAPKKILLRDLTIAFAKNDVSLFVENMKDDIVWDVVGKKLIENKEDFMKSFNKMTVREVSEVHIENIITHGKTCSINGIIKLKDETSIAFCDVYNFTSAGKNTIKKITSYHILLA